MLAHMLCSVLPISFLKRYETGNMSGKKSKKSVPPATQEGQFSEMDYNWIIVFSWDENDEEPFEVFQRSCFSNREVPSILYTKILTPECRVKKVKLSGLKGLHYSLFCKIEIGEFKFLK